MLLAVSEEARSGRWRRGRFPQGIQRLSASPATPRYLIGLGPDLPDGSLREALCSFQIGDLNSCIIGDDLVAVHEMEEAMHRQLQNAMAGELRIEDIGTRAY
jgi:hypothetical protein